MRKILTSANCIFMALQICLNVFMLDKNKNLPPLHSFSYYQNHRLNHVEMKELVNLKNEPYLIYFYGDGCPACQKSDEYMSAFLYYGFFSKTDVYFVDVSINDQLCGLQNESDVVDENFKIIYTPTLLFFHDDEIELAQGSEEVISKLDEIVKS